MAGSSEESSAKKAKPLARSFACPACGGTVTIRYPGAALSCVCEFCQTVIDATDSNYRIIEKYFSKTRHFEPFVPLGTRGKLKGKDWEVVGYMVRADEVSGYFWDEYLLFNPYYGYRWLTCNGDHWSFVTTIKQKPQSRTHSQSTSWYKVKMELEGRDFKLFYRGRAKVLFVLGEFYWKVKADSLVNMEDYISPPYMLSSESDGKEIVWSISEYLEVDDVAAAFKPAKKLKRPSKVAPNQPSSAAVSWQYMSKLWLASFVILTVLQVWQLGYNNSRQVLDSSPVYTANAKNAPTYTTAVFNIDRDKTGALLEFSTSVDNSWLYVSGEMVNDDTGETFPFAQTIEYYHGYDGGESWSEGGTSNNVFLSAVPKGKYYLNIDTESGDFKDTNPHVLNVVVKQSPPLYGNYFWCLFLLSLLPGISAWSNTSFESTRWSESDYNPYASTG